MAYYIALVGANSPLFTYTPAVGFDPSHNWVTTYLDTASPILYYYTSAPTASVSFDFYGDEFELIAPGEPGCAYNITINGALQTEGFHDSFYLSPGQYHVELDVLCAAGQSMNFEGVIFEETQDAASLQDQTVYLTPKDIHTVGQWQKEDVYSQYFLMPFTQYQTHTWGSTLEYTFKGVQTEIVGSVGPDGSDFIVTLDGKPTKVYSTYNPVQGDDVTLWEEQYLDNSKTHIVTLTNLGSNLTVLNVNYEVLVPST